jgi:hypothetical protein
VGPLLLGSDELRELRARADTAVYSTAKREISLRTADFDQAVSFIDAILEARRAA